MTSTLRATRAYLCLVAVAVVGFGALATRPVDAAADASLPGPGGGVATVFHDGAFPGGEVELPPTFDAITPAIAG